MTWANGETSVATENIAEATGVGKCPAHAHGDTLNHENKVSGTITGGTDASLVGGMVKRKTCLYQGNGICIELLPNTLAKY